ncbi:MAG: translational GTPase TypA [Thermoflavifilum sp.]|nr:translational GTPase TypA [Thermoflavifilum sp.]MCL6513413.1 translational GTPase TypA [Alicyclobacillus sp.]
MIQPEYLRNVAIIAHVDHGKTSLVDQLLRQSGLFRSNEQLEERAMDRDELERERGITILAKTTSIPYGEYKINVVDTPGHADFSGEVERIVTVVDGALLVVDAVEGVMPQTRFVLRKALDAGLAPVVVVNKIDRPMARPLEVVDEVLELFMDLGADDRQLDFPVVYTSAALGYATADPSQPTGDMRLLFDVIIRHIPAPQVTLDGPVAMQAALLDYNEFVGRIGIGRIHRGVLQAGQTVAWCRRDGSVTRTRIQKLFGFQGLRRLELDEAGAGDIVGIAGIPEITVGETVCDPEHVEPLPLLSIEEPTLQMTFLVNDSPFAGRDGKYVTSRKLRERLYAETEADVSLRVEDTEDTDAFLVSARGELHLSILIEKMRREGYELQVSKPTVITREEHGTRLEPVELVTVDVPSEYAGAVIEELGRRRGELRRMDPSPSGDSVRLEFLAPTRGLIGFRSIFLTLTRGYGTMHHRFFEYAPWRGDVVRRRQGVLVASETGIATSYALQSLEDRGVMFITPGTEVYEGMIVGEHTRENDLTVNVTKQKHMTNIRSSTKEETVRLKAPRLMSLEDAVTYIEDDELCEVTPKHIRLRKRLLSKSERERAAKRSGAGVEG